MRNGLLVLAFRRQEGSENSEFRLRVLRGAPVEERSRWFTMTRIAARGTMAAVRGPNEIPLSSQRIFTNKKF
jgi:hypothetical protein